MHDFIPNELLVHTLMETLAPYSRRVRHILQDEEEGEEVDFADKRLVILNSLPAQIAEHLRKLMVPMADADKRYDNISSARLAQLIQTASVSMELYVCIQLAQLYEARMRHPQSKENKHFLSQDLRSFFQPTYDQSAYDFLPLLAECQREFASIDMSWGIRIPAFQQLLDQLEEGSPLIHACLRLHEIQQDMKESQMAKASSFDLKISELCQEAEEHLAFLLGEMSFLAQYSLISIGRIFVQQHYLNPPVYHHEMQSWKKLLSGLETKRRSLPHVLNSQSVAFFEKNDMVNKLFGLSPLLLMMSDKRSDIHSLYQFSYVDPSENQFFVKNVIESEDIVSITEESHPNLYKQAEAFAQLMFGCSVWDLRGG